MKTVLVFYRRRYQKAGGRKIGEKNYSTLVDCCFFEAIRGNNGYCKHKISIFRFPLQIFRLFFVESVQLGFKNWGFCFFPLKSKHMATFELVCAILAFVGFCYEFLCFPMNSMGFLHMAFAIVSAPVITHSNLQYSA